jgi:hypothetical protein
MRTAQKLCEIEQSTPKLEFLDTPPQKAAENSNYCQNGRFEV